MEDVAEEPLILYPKAPRPSYADQILGNFRARGLSPRVAFEAREVQTALGLVAAGAGVTLVPQSMRRHGRSDIAYCDLDEPTIRSPIIVRWRRGDVSPVWGLFLRLASECMEEKDERTLRQAR